MIQKILDFYDFSFCIHSNITYQVQSVGADLSVAGAGTRVKKAPGRKFRQQSGTSTTRPLESVCPACAPYD